MEESILHEIDPDGDTLLILHNANAPFAVLSPSTSQEKYVESVSTPAHKLAGEKKVTDGKPEDAGGNPEDADGNPEDADGNQKDADGNSEDADDEPEDAGGKPEDADDEPTIRMRLSSKHLTLASVYFQKLTANNWKETTPKSGYSYVIDAYDWDEQAFLILMNIIHGRTAKVPRIVSIETCAKIAVLVDYYNCHEAVEFFAQTWLTSLLATAPEEGERLLMLRLVVFLMFSKNFNSQPLANSIVLNSSGPINSLGLPIPQDIIDALNKKRVDIISSVLVGLYDLRKKLCGDQKSCTFECSSINLGALLKALNRMGVIEPIPTPPYPGLSLLRLEKGIRDIKEPMWMTNCQGLTMYQSTFPKPEPGRNSNSIFGSIVPSRPDRTETVTDPAPRVNTTGFVFTTPPATKPLALLNITPNPACKLSERTRPIIDGILSKLNELRLATNDKPQ